MNDLVIDVRRQVTNAPVPSAPITARLGTRQDIPFIDGLQKQYGKALGFFPRAQMEGYIDNGWILVAEMHSVAVGYVAARDRYLKRDELGVIYQLCVSPSAQRGLIGATLLKELFARSAYGCRLYCCWCAQDLAANKFWEAMGFQAIAFRGGSAKKSRVHIFWQKRIRSADTSTPWWFPSKTEGGAMREDRLVLPIPPALHWSDPMPVMKATTIPGGCPSPDASSSPRRSRKKALEDRRPPVTVTKASSRFGPPGAVAIVEAAIVEPVIEAPSVPAVIEKPRQAKAKLDPNVIAAARELRDRYLEQVNESDVSPAIGKYDVTRAIETRGAMRASERITVDVVPPKRLAA